ncbi:MAG: DNA ligase (NAD(+)) LigA [Firmicutes bacterium HGW-Firmicutes-1]|nr:MAG: DNA ligase (NAD(+)) LigA [Firmicutes bacterium HGW-Firmicutes-1]
MLNKDITTIKELAQKLNLASKAYYLEDQEIMTNFEYDQLYDELLMLENKTGFVLSDSPTQKVGYEVLSSLPKEKHESIMLSLDKTKDAASLKDWIKEQRGILSWKLDGLTIVLTYENGLLTKAVTRGNGLIGEVITNNARVFKNIPTKISFKKRLILRGEAVIKYSDFNKLNELLPVEEQYKNPRNLCSGSVRQLNNEITAKRNVHFFAFQLVQADEVDLEDSKVKQLEWLEQLGFETVEHRVVTKDNIAEQIENFAREIVNNDFGSDGLVLTYDSIEYSNGLGATSKFPKHSIAFKWRDEIKETTLTKIEWSASRTGLINPIAIFEPIELEGTTVSRASVHNLSILEELELGIGDIIEVYKANMIIPQIADNLTRSNNITIPKLCPVCGEACELRQISQVKALYCSNVDCTAKKIKSYAHFVSRDAMNIEGISEATLEKFVSDGLIKTLGDIFRLEDHKQIIVQMEGFGEKSYQNIINSIEKSKKVYLSNFIYALGISNVGLSNAKLLCRSLDNSFVEILKVKTENLLRIEGFGEVIATSVVEFFGNEKNIEMIQDLMKYISFIKEEINNNELILEGKVFVITGSLEKYENRNALKDKIEALGGKVTGSVTSKTDYLINNDVQSTSSKNKTAVQLGVTIINEEDFEKLMS